MPSGDLGAMLDLAQSIRSRERLQNISDAVIASGWAKKGSVTSHMRRLEEAASRMGDPADPRQRPAPSQRAIDASLHRAGIEIVRAKRG